MGLSRKFLILWELPQILLALSLFLILRKKITGFKLYKDSNIYLVRGFPGGVSLSFMIFLSIDEKDNLEFIKHEYGHTIQSLYLGPLYLIIVGLPSIIRAVVWNIYKLENKKYHEGFPENWADRLGGV
jgi:hypothetical protein